MELFWVGLLVREGKMKIKLKERRKFTQFILGALILLGISMITFIRHFAYR